MNTRFLSKPKKSFWDSKKVLITGHTGFKGSWLSLWLLQMNAQVSGISLKPENPNNLFDQLKIEKDLNHIICDIRDKDSLKKKYYFYKTRNHFSSRSTTISCQIIYSANNNLGNKCDGDTQCPKCY